MINNTISNITSEYCGFLISYENRASFINISDSAFHNITSTYGIFDSSNTRINLSNCTFDSIINLNFRLEFSLIYLKNILIENIKCEKLENGCVFSFVLETMAYLNDIKLKKISNFEQLGNIYVENSEVQIRNMIFIEGFATKLTGSGLFSENSNITINSSLFYFYNFNSFFLLQTNFFMSNCTFNNSDFEILKYAEKGAIFCNSCPIFILQNSIFFSNNNSKIGGGASLSGDSNATFNISNCFFGFNKVSNSGGAISLSSVKGEIKSSYFYSNQATLGGAIYYFTDGDIFLNYFL